METPGTPAAETEWLEAPRHGRRIHAPARGRSPAVDRRAHGERCRRRDDKLVQRSATRSQRMTPLNDEGAEL